MGTVAGLGSRNDSVLPADGRNPVGWLRSRKSWCEPRTCTPEGFPCLFRQIWDSSKVAADWGSPSPAGGEGDVALFSLPSSLPPTCPHAAPIYPLAPNPSLRGWGLSKGETLSRPGTQPLPAAPRSAQPQCSTFTRDLPKKNNNNKHHPRAG